MSAWLDDEGRFFNPTPAVNVHALPGGGRVVVVDDALARPQGLVEWARAQVFEPPRGYPYPGVNVDAPADVAQRTADFFSLHVRKALGVRRVLDLMARLSMVTMAPAQLQPGQWQCHRDRIAADPQRILFAASVLYLFRDPALGGTSFYVPRRPMAEIERMLADAQRLAPAEFSHRYGVRPGYMSGSNEHFERVASVPAAWNRLIFYDGGLFHSGDVREGDEALPADPAQGRLTLNSFLTCRRDAG